MDPGPGTPRVFLTDFGLAKSVATGSKLTRTGVALGTPAYMSPEQARGDLSSLAPATDVWALGCVLHEMLAGRPAFAGETPAEVVARAILSEPRRLRSLRPDVPRGVETVVRVALQKEPTGRHPDASALRADLDRLLRGERPAARAPRKPRLLPVAAGVALAAASGGALYLARDPGSASPASGAVPSAARASRAEALAARGRGLRFADSAEAERLLGEALGLEPGRHDWRIERGLLLASLGRPAEAREELARVPPESPVAESARLSECLLISLSLDPEELVVAIRASSAMLRVLAAGEGRVARIASAALAFVAARRDEAWQILRDEPGWEAALLRACVLERAADRDPRTVRREYDIVLAEGLPFPWVLYNRGNLRVELGEPTGAIEDYSHAIRLAPGSASAWNNRGGARRTTGDLHGALADFSEAVRLRAEEPSYRNNRGTARKALGDLGGAIADYTEALRLRPVYGEASFNRAKARLETGDATGALADLDEAVARIPKDSDVFHERAVLRWKLGDLNGSLADATEALRLMPDRVEALIQRAICLQLLEDPKGAVEDLTRALEMSPGHVQALNDRASARLDLGDLAGAEADCRAALRLRKELPEVHGNLAMVLQARDDLQGAADAYEEFLRLAPAHVHASEIRKSLANCREALAARAAGR